MQPPHNPLEVWCTQGHVRHKHGRSSRRVCTQPWTLLNAPDGTIDVDVPGPHWTPCRWMRPSLAVLVFGCLLRSANLCSDVSERTDGGGEQGRCTAFETTIVGDERCRWVGQGHREAETVV